MSCEYCGLITGKSKGEILYEDDDLVVAVKDIAVTPGHVVVFPKEHFPIMEMVPDNLVKKCGIAANKVSVAAFESLGAQGTNIIVKNGTGAGQSIPHFALEIIPRQEGDGLSFEWPALKQGEDELEIVAEQLKQGLSKIDLDKEKRKVSKPEESSGKKSEAKDNYLLKSLKRKP